MLRQFGRNALVPSALQAAIPYLKNLQIIQQEGKGRRRIIAWSVRAQLNCTATYFLLVHCARLSLALTRAFFCHWGGVACSHRVIFFCVFFALFLRFCSLSSQAKQQAETDMAPGTITMDDLPAPPGNGSTAGGDSARDNASSSVRSTVSYANLKG